MNKLKKTALDNKDIFKSGYYINKHGKKVDIKSLCESSIENTLYLEDTVIKSSVQNAEKFIVADNIINTGTIDCILKLRTEGEDGNIIALNFASATTPGGGYLNGSTAQEESLCRASMLYPCLTKDMSMYKKNKAEYSPLYTDRMKYSPDVPIIRNDNGELIDTPVLASFITSPAVNRKVATKMLISNNKINEAMDIRIRKILTVALQYKPSVIVLGAFGCGVFGNKKEVVYKIFENAINEIVPLNEVKVVFAVRPNVSRQ